MSDARALAIFTAALERPDEEREAFIAERGADDPAVLSAALRLLRAHAASTGFMETTRAATPPSTLGAYRLLKSIGSGGMGQVWLAERRDGAFQHKVAIKVLASALGDPEAIRRAESERQFLAWLNHPNIAHVIDGGSTPDGQPYVVMEYVEGERIDQWCNQRGLDLRGRVQVFLQVLAALDAAHRALIIHRDIKPSNVLVTGDGMVKLLDFGIAKSLADTRTAAQTSTGLMALTPQYASPEQLGGLPLTTASDIYSLGLLLYELLSGVPARPAGSYAIGDLVKLLDAPPPTRPSQRVNASALALPDRACADWRRRLSGDLDRIVLKALAPEQERRYASAQAFADDLRNWLAQRPVSARGDSRRYRIGKFLRRNRLPVAATALAVLAVLAGLAVAIGQAQRASHEAERARQANRFLLDMIAQADPFVSGGTPTLEQAINQAAATLGDRFHDQPELEGDIRHSLGRAYLSLNRLDAAHWQLERSIALRRGGDPTDLAEALDSLAMVEWSYGRYQRSEQLLTEALAVLGHSERERAVALMTRNDYSALLNELGRYAEAQAQLESAMRAIDAGVPVSDGDHAALLGNLGYALHGLERLEEASITYGRARTLLESSGASAPDRAINLNNHALVLRDLNQREQALALQERSLELRRQAFPGGHPMVIQALSNIAINYVEAGRRDDARRAVTEAMASAPQHFPAGNVALGHIYRNGARVMLELDDPVAALDLVRRALAVYDGNDAVQDSDRQQAERIAERARAHPALPRPD